jgi:hypothetical protein
VRDLLGGETSPAAYYSNDSQEQLFQDRDATGIAAPVGQL